MHTAANDGLEPKTAVERSNGPCSPHVGLFAFSLAQRDRRFCTGIGCCQRPRLLLLWLFYFPVPTCFVAFSHHEFADDAGWWGETGFEGGIAVRFQVFREGRGLPGVARNSFKSNCFFGDETPISCPFAVVVSKIDRDGQVTGLSGLAKGTIFEKDLSDWPSRQLRQLGPAVPNRAYYMVTAARYFNRTTASRRSLVLVA
jgi:hypothetical protein